MGGAAVRFDEVWKRFRRGEAHDSLRDLVASAAARCFGRRSKPAQSAQFWALRDVSFDVGAGESLGIIGPNGAGKSTALKLLAGILRPERGSIDVTGRLAALIEIGAGFHGDLTGRENVFLNGAILGMDRREIRAKLGDIVEFAGIGPFLDTPVKRYSSGMYARLGFSIAAHVDPDVLLVDEVLSVGDAVFRLRCLERMRELLRGGTTLVFVTHNLDQMQAVCPRAIVLDHGQAVFVGSSHNAVGHYLQAVSRTYASVPTDVKAEADGGPGQVELLDLRFASKAGAEAVWARSREPLRAELLLRFRRPIPRAVVELNMRATTHENLLSFNSGRGGVTFDCRAGEHRISLALPALSVRGGQYFWNVRVWDADRGTTELDTPFRFPLVLDDEGRSTGTLCLEHEWAHAAEPASAAPVEAMEPVAAGGGRP